MNCQITKLYDKYIDLEIVSSKVDSHFSLLSIVRIGSNDYLENTENTTNIQSDLFGKIIEVGIRTLKLELLRPQLFFVGKIVKIDPIQSKISFLPDTLNNKIAIGETKHSKPKTEVEYEFIPTVQVGENVIQGQKIGYLNISTNNSKQNSKFWILSVSSGNVSKIALGDFKFGNTLAVVNKQNIILGNENLDIIPGDLLLKVQSITSNISLDNSETAIIQSIKTSSRNIILDPKKQFLNNINIDTENLNNSIFIFVTQNNEFRVDYRYHNILLFDKYRFGDSIRASINDLTLAICESGYSVVVISDFDLKIDTVGQYKTINGEEVTITSIFYTHDTNANSKYFSNSVILD
jgi:hypothetical protein